VSDPYTIVLWGADVDRFTSMVAVHLLSEGISAANSGRIDDEIPVTIGLADWRRWPIFSREVSASGLIRVRAPRVTTPRHDYLFTVFSGQFVESNRARDVPRSSRVVAIHTLVEALESVSPSRMSREEIVRLFDDAAHEPIAGTGSKRAAPQPVHEIADVCQRFVIALTR
jgi:hypothetical protein